MTIHSTAIVDPKAELHESVVVEAFSIIGPEVKMGAGTAVGPHCVITGRTEIGENNQFFSGSQIGILSQDLKHRDGLVGRTIIGANNMFREHCTISASTLSTYDDDHRVTSIGDACLFMAYSHVGHDCHVASNVIMANCAALAGHVEVEDYAGIGGLTGIHQECTVGRLSYVGAMSRVTKDVPPFMIVEGNPAKCHGPNSVGLRRRGLDADGRKRVKDMYRIVFRSDLNTTQALHEVEATIDDCEERNHLIEFFRKSLRGVTMK
ncbi:MAG: acyl-ACP--UDP-N-acetylglucosamine O-acyltransferase [bacterium]|nr:acyl-ACP--UDP-N-acetylglucosamine O-acyltransferase [bacterium]